MEYGQAHSPFPSEGGPRIPDADRSAGGTAYSAMAGAKGRLSVNIELELAPEEARHARRRSTRLKADVRRSGPTRIPAVITDLSVTGFRVEAQEPLPVDATVWVRIPPLTALMARVRWTRGYEAGCEFDRPLHEAVLDHVAAHRA